jgi:hypothetical protein
MQKRMGSESVWDTPEGRSRVTPHGIARHLMATFPHRMKMISFCTKQSNTMNIQTQKSTLKILAAAMAGFGLTATAPADDSRTVVEVERVALKPEVTATFVDGYTVPGEYRTHFTEFPAIDGTDVVVRYHKGRAYYVNKGDWKIVRVVDLDPTVKTAKEYADFVQGYVIPENRRVGFVEVPTPEAAVHVRYYNNAAYYMDSSFRIIRIVPLHQ